MGLFQILWEVLKVAAKRKALITGITGQDGAYLAELLLSKGYEVHGIKRRSSLFNTQRVDHLFVEPHQEGGRFRLHYGDMTDSTNLIRILQEVQPDEIYNLAAQSHVMVSFDTPEYTANADALGPLRILEAMRILGLAKQTRFYQASTSELFGKVSQVPQSETTPFYPRSPYGAAKLYGYWITVNYREAYDLFASNGILFNHESPLRGETFVTRKVTRAVARIVQGRQERLYLGNLNAQRDWGHARDFVEAMWLILQHSRPEDFVIATGIVKSVREMVVEAFGCVGVGLEFHGSGAEEIGTVRDIDEDCLRSAASGESHLKPGAQVVSVDPSYYRPAEVDLLVGDSSKARDLLGWRPKYSFHELISEMVQADLRSATALA